ncbi:hypothetical protein BGZ65_000417 [Modicella reniformis]|uniref:NADH:flavin oxidoreductase/NADH oxidase N-terminal domain-containing protein n=1 Tax=Modicella reniformis TaxID=1440133 RepID=A0A9P6MC16_9FUNG|nr:hypothetical protein BGZ65_000417 [Modicella reniformis]
MEIVLETVNLKGISLSKRKTDTGAPVPDVRTCCMSPLGAIPGLSVVAVGIIVDGQQAEEVLEQEKADLVAAGRGFLRHPNFALNAARDLNVKAGFSQQYSRGRTILG